MPIDPSIVLAGMRQPEQIDPMGVLGKVLTLRNQQQQNQAGQLELQQRQQQFADQQKMNDAYAAAFTKNDAGVVTFNRDTLVSSLAKNNLGQHIPAILETLDKAEKSTADVVKARAEADTATRDAIGAFASGVKIAGYTSEAFNAAVAHMLQNKLLTPEDVRPYLQAVQQDPSHVRSIVDQILAQSPKQTELATSAATAASRMVSAQKPTEATLAVGAQSGDPQAAGALALLKPPKEPTTPTLGSAADYIGRYAKEHGLDPTSMTAEQSAAALKQYRDATQKTPPSLQPGPSMPAWSTDDSRPAGAGRNVMDMHIRMTPNGLYQAALNYIANGQYPPTGRGSDPIAVAQRAAVTSKVGAIAAASGMDEPALRAFYKANGASLTQQQKMYDAVQGFMATADKNAALLQTSLKKLPNVGSPIFNLPLRNFAKNVSGDPNMSQFATYLQSVQNEYGRIISQPNLAGQLTDSARTEAETLIDPKATVKQIVASVQALTNEGNNRLVSVGEQIQRIQQRLSATPGQAPTPPASSSPAALTPTAGAGRGLSSSAAGGVTVTSPSGKRYTFKSQGEADAAVANAKAAGLWK